MGTPPAPPACFADGTVGITVETSRTLEFPSIVRPEHVTLGCLPGTRDAGKAGKTCHRYKGRMPLPGPEKESGQQTQALGGKPGELSLSWGLQRSDSLAYRCG